MSRGQALILKLITAGLAAAVFLALLVLGGLIVALRLPQQELTGGLHLFEDRGGNSTVLVTSEGVLVVDTKLWKFSRRLRKAVSSLSDKPVKYVINTHYHKDHVHGNLEFPPTATFVSSARTLSHLLRLDAAFWSDPEARKVLPRVAFEEKDHQIRLGGQLIHVVQVGRGHTNGDCVVYFPTQGVVATGDLFYNGYFPTVDHEAGGSYIDWIETIDRILALGPRQVIPGHGPVAEPAELKAFQGYLRDLLTEVGKLKAQGKSRAEVMALLKLPVHQARLRNYYRTSSLAINAGEAYDELARGGQPPPRPTLGVEALEGEPEENRGEGAEGNPEPTPTLKPGDKPDPTPADASKTEGKASEGEKASAGKSSEDKPSPRPSSGSTP